MLFWSISLSQNAIQIMQRSNHFSQLHAFPFYDMIETSIEVFMDEFSVFSHDFDKCLGHLNFVLNICIKINLV